MPIMMGESWLAGTWIHCIPVSKQREINAGVPLVSPCSFILAQVQEIEVPTCGQLFSPLRTSSTDVSQIGPGDLLPR